ncbi:hypothetical protein [Streptomyces sp. NPDC006368]|uniref:hypothetical protein n=1 Tax=Streptomyces sp. NPDC006368 TaxID=3156760 RepID=UPI0033B49E60
MWPGQQPPGGEQNPQDQNPNPYQQPGYPQQPNPYQQPTAPQYAVPGHPPQPQQQPGYAQPAHPQQPGYPQPNPYQQPTVPQYAVPGHPPGSPMPPRGGGGKKTTVIAIAAATAVVVAAGVTGFLVLKDDGTKTKAGGDDKPSQSASTESSPSAIDNPRDGSDAAKPTIPGWKVVSNPKHGTLFDVPADWEVAGPGTIMGLEDEKKGDGSPLVTMSSPAYLKDEWCADDVDKDGRDETWSLSTAGTKGGQGAKNTQELARNEAAWWVYGGYAQDESKSAVKPSDGKPYTTKSGLSGHVSTATARNSKASGKCDTDGKALAFSFKNARGDFATFVLYGAAGVKDQLPDATVQRILSTVRLAEPAS